MRAASDDGSSLVRWAPKAPRHLVRRLYQSEARGIRDNELIDTLGYALLDRCRSIQSVTAAHRLGQVTCPSCGRLIHRSSPNPWRGGPLVCRSCGWSTTWRAYFATYQGKGLTGGSALPAFSEFCTQFLSAGSSRQKLLAIDALLNAFHHQLTRSTRPAAAQLIEGSRTEVLALLDAINQTPGAQIPDAERARRRDALSRAELGEQIRQLRLNRRLTERQVANLVDTSTSRICLVETGRVSPPRLVGRIARALGATEPLTAELVAAAETINASHHRNP